MYVPLLLFDFGLSATSVEESKNSHLQDSSRTFELERLKSGPLRNRRSRPDSGKMARKIARRADRLFDKVFPQSLDSQIEQFAPQGMTDFQRRCTDISEVESKWRTHLSKISFPISFKSCQPSLNHGLMSLADCSGPPEMAPRQPYWHIIRQTYGGEKRGLFCLFP